MTKTFLSSLILYNSLKWENKLAKLIFEINKDYPDVWGRPLNQTGIVWGKERRTYVLWEMANTENMQKIEDNAENVSLAE